ncbi:MAG: PAS domain S-box protein [Ignavibacteria bacterium]|nr:PAS domain S-box protein [Ignavibacteria bacterium]
MNLTNDTSNTILIVEDDEGLNRLISIHLAREGFLTDSVYYGKDAISRIAKDTYMMLLLDYMLPDMTGEALIKELTIKGCNLPFVVMTGHGDERIAVNMMKLGASDYIVKSEKFIDILPQKIKIVQESVKQKRRLIASEMEKEKTDKALKESEEFTRRIIASSNDCIKVLDLEGNLISMSEGGQKLLEIEDINVYLNKSWVDFWKGKDREDALEAISKAKKGDVGMFTGYCETAKGTPKWWEIIVTPIEDSHGNTYRLLSISRDITERKKAEEKIKHLNLVLRAIRNVNQLITKEKDRDKLLKGACNNLIETRGYHNAWIALLDESGKLITTAEAGLGKDFLPVIEMLKSGKITACGKNALKKSDIVITDTPLDECKECPLSEKYTGRAAVTIRLEYEGKIYGLMAVSIPAELIKDKEEHSLFKEVAGDISFALYSLEVDKELKKTQDSLKERIKELLCLYGIAEISKRTKITLAELYQEAVNLFPPSWQYPEITGGCINIEGKVYKTDNFKKTKWLQRADIRVKNEIVGAVEVCYLKEKPDEYEGPFHKEERDLINEIAKQLGDITERKNAEEQIRFQADIIDNSPVIAAYHDKDLNTIWVNKAYQKATGLSLEEVSGKKCYEVWNLSGPCRGCPVVTAIETGESAASELTLNNQDHWPEAQGSWLSRAAPFRDEQGTIIGAIEFAIDITERKQAEEALKDNEEKLNAIVNNSFDLMTLFDLEENKLVWLNNMWQEVLGWSLEKIIDPLEPCHPDDREKVVKAMTDIIQGRVQEINDFEYRYKTSKGIYHYFTSNITKINIGGKYYIFTDAHDITERKQAEKELRESEEKYRLLAESSPEMIYLVDTKGYISYVNKVAAAQFNVPAREIVGKHLKDIFPPDLAQRNLESIQNVIATKSNYQNEVEMVFSTGHKWVDARLSPVLNEKNHVTGVLGLSYDITERKKAELEVMNSREQLRNLSSHLQTIREDERGNIAREIHDDLGQSLTALKMDMSWFKKHLPEDDDSSDKKINGMINLVDETIKSVQRISTELRPAVLDDLGFSSAVKWFMSEFKERSGLKCQLDITPDDIVLDEKLSIAMYRIFQESLTNILRHANATEVNVNIVLANNELEMILADNGIGIDEEKLQDPKSIGLIGMQERMYPWHGSVEITGEKGKGTVVRVNVKF